jgi:surface antigen
VILRFSSARPPALWAVAFLSLWQAALAPAPAAAQSLPASANPEIYADLDPGDANAALDLMRRTLESELSWRVASWKNRENGRGGSITPVRTFRTEDGVFCREYRESVQTAKRVVAEIAVACRDPAEGWVRVPR